MSDTRTDPQLGLDISRGFARQDFRYVSVKIKGSGFEHSYSYADGEPLDKRQYEAIVASFAEALSLLVIEAPYRDSAAKVAREHLFHEILKEVEE